MVQLQAVHKGGILAVFFLFGILISPVNANVSSQLPIEEQFNEIESDIQDIEKVIDSDTNPELVKIIHKLMKISKKVDMIYESSMDSDTFQKETIDRFYKIIQKLDDIEEKINILLKQMNGGEDSKEENPFVKKIKKQLIKLNLKNKKIDRLISIKKLIMIEMKNQKLEQEYIRVFQKVNLEELKKHKFYDKRFLSDKVFTKISDEKRWDLLQYFLDKQQKINNLDSETKLSPEELSDKIVSLYKFKSKFDKYWEKIQKAKQKEITKIEKEQSKTIKKNEKRKISDAQLSNILENLEVKKNNLDLPFQSLDCQPYCSEFLAFAELSDDLAYQQALLEFIKSNSKLVDELGLEGFIQLQENISHLGQIESSVEIFENFDTLLGENIATTDNNDLKKEDKKKDKKKKDKKKKDKKKKDKKKKDKKKKDKKKKDKKKK